MKENEIDDCDKPMTTIVLRSANKRVDRRVSATVSIGQKKQVEPQQNTVMLTKVAQSLADRINRSFFDLTSGDRLQKWKSKLSGSKHRNSKKYDPKPTTLHSSHSSCTVSVSSPLMPDSLFFPHSNVLSRHDSFENNMDQHKLAHCQESVLNQPTSNRQLPPPARITPFSGITPKDAQIVRPIAFRPAHSKNDSNSSFFGNFRANTDQSYSMTKMHSDLNLRPDFLSIKPFLPPSTDYFSSNRPKTIYQSANDGKNRSNGSEMDDDYYDIVPEFVDLPKLNNNTNNTTTSYGSGQSSGIHVSPLPSDSEVPDFEALLRKKDSELVNLRRTMEQNEEIIVRVYQEKEDRFKEQLKEWTSKLHQAVQTERQLKTQLAIIQEDRAQMQLGMQRLAGDRQGLQRKCLQIEQQMFTMRYKLEYLGNQRGICQQCSKSTEEENTDPVPQTRLYKNSCQSSTQSANLRLEIDSLRSEVFNLKETLTKQIGLFVEERRKLSNEEGLCQKWANGHFCTVEKTIVPSNRCTRSCSIEKDGKNRPKQVRERLV